MSSLDIAAEKAIVMPKKKFKFSPSQLFLNLFFVFFIGLILVPFVLLVVISFTDNNEILQKGYRFWAENWSTAAYQTLFENPRMVVDAYKVTIFVTVLGTALHVLICALFAYPLTFRNLPGQKFFTFFMFFTMLFSGGLVASYIINTQFLGFKNSYMGLIVPLMFSPFNVLVIRTYFATSFPKEIEESAKIDGASDFRIFFQMVLPLSAPVLATVGLFSALGYWNDWFQSLLYISKDDMFSLQYVMLKTMRAIEAMQRLMALGVSSAEAIEKLRQLPTESVQFAMVTLGIGPIIMAYPFFQRFIVKGLTVGAIKG
jgi:putative aldouronate transport system permease protein